MRGITFGMATRLEGATGTSVVGPLITSAGKNYFFSSGRSLLQEGENRPVEVETEEGWYPVGKRIIWGSDENAEFVIVELFPNIGVMNRDRGLEKSGPNWKFEPDEGTGVMIVTNRQEEQVTLQGSLCKKIPFDPQKEKALAKLLGIRCNTGETLQKSDAGAGIWTSSGELIGILWKPYGTNRNERIALVMPILDYYQSMTWKFEQLIREYESSDKHGPILDTIRNTKEDLKASRISCYRHC